MSEEFMSTKSNVYLTASRSERSTHPVQRCLIECEHALFFQARCNPRWIIESFYSDHSTRSLR
jgi:hypothetical protein